MAVESRVVNPKVTKALFQAIAEASRPGLVVGEKETLRGAAADRDQRKLARQIRGRIRAAKAQRVAVLVDHRVERRNDVVLDVVVLLGQENDAVSLNAGLERIIEMQQHFEDEQGYDQPDKKGDQVEHQRS